MSARYSSARYSCGMQKQLYGFTPAVFLISVFATTLFLIAGVFGILSVQASPDVTVIRVATTGVDATGCGATANPCRTVQYAVDLAAEGSEIRVAGGVYMDTHTRAMPVGYTGPSIITQVLYVDKTISVRGGYSTINWVTPNEDANPTILNAQQKGRVLFIARPASGQPVSPTIEGLRLTGGNATRLGGLIASMDYGGGVFVLQAAPRIASCVIYSNTASVNRWGYGGGLYLRLSEAVLSGNRVMSNTASQQNTGWGGGAFFNFSPAMFTSNEVRGNIASAAAASSFGSGNGGGLYIVGSNTVVRNNLIEDNHASLIVPGNGGGLSIDEGYSIALSGNLIRDNVASKFSQGQGGGLYLIRGSAILNGNVVVNNTATLSPTAIGRGGGVYVYNSSLTALNTVVNDNHANSEGDGLWISGSPGRFTHTTIADNDGAGQGIYANLTPVLFFTNTIIADHHGVGITASQGSVVTMMATLWYDNATNSGGAGTIISNTNYGGNPAFGPDGYHLAAGSAALDRGLSTGAAIDVDGEPRAYGSAPDLGADEYWSPGALKRVYVPIAVR